MTEIIKKTLYWWGVEIDFYPNSHQYKLNGERITSVTTITWIVDKSPQLMYRAINLYKELLLEYRNQWLEIDKEVIEKWAKEYKTVSKEATDVWTLVHDYCEAYANALNPELPENEQAKNWCSAFLNRVRNNDIKFIENERFVYSRKYNYCGKLDTIIEWNWKTYLADFKTSKAVYLLEYWMQTSAYLEAYQEETGKRIDGRIIIKLGKETWDFEVHILEDHEKDFQAFLSALTLLNRKKECEKLQKDFIL